ncbi:hypothetical protein [Microbulbifer epialgicus]|uniref:Uncharacterized protein n=1 Tax=Microbulbifer epialgicus TaxID=393907 RepID=A0ABV4NVK3_9GAMM
MAVESSRLLTISIREETLIALLAQRHLCAEDLYCPTPRAHQQLRRALLRTLVPVTKPG